jgi:putative transposase
VCHKIGIADATYYVWLRLLDEEHRKLKQLVADLSLDKVMLQSMVIKKLLCLPRSVLG